jgi:hypothetical protein
MESIRQEKRQRDREFEDSDSQEWGIVNSLPESAMKIFNGRYCRFSINSQRLFLLGKLVS